MRILNITADYPDVFKPNKTKAVKLLISESNHDHFIISINRCSSPHLEKWEEMENGVSISYFSPPMGLMLRFFLRRLASKIKNYIKSKSILVDFIVAHKMTVEGLIAKDVAINLGVGYGVSLWGSTDKKFIKLKPELQGTYRDVYHDAHIVFPASPWIREYVEQKLNCNSSSIVLLPVVTNNTLPCSPTSNEINFVSVFNLDLYRLKGLPCLLEVLSGYEESWSLDIYGVGSFKSVKSIRKLLQKLGIDNRVRLMGQVDNERITEVISQYHSFLMPTTSETYGMVYIEALFAGVPILYSKNQGVDGYFDEVDIGVKVIPSVKKSILKGITELVSMRSDYVENISKLHENGFFDKFKKKSIVNSFDQALMEVKDHG
ncbi:glycosyltransferase family 4 protein [Litoribacillus peritrichatus]|uniref:Glycosyl transferase family 1 domain-containing protein n=1 Tax=Litoribacillus peritrichatus TaxID=718191 RepID=A0ABP7M1D7_9GAMM